MKAITDDIPWQWLIIIFLIGSCLFGQCSNGASSDKPATYPTFTNAEIATSRARGACEQDAMNGVPYEYSRCNPDPQSEEPLSDPYDSLDPYADDIVGGCPDGCMVHPQGCDIKGNIAYDSGEKIYHVPGQEFYAATTINPDYGERWFCTEQEAISNGWRKAY